MKQTRANRRKKADTAAGKETPSPKSPKGKGPERIYYAIITVLLVILAGIMLFIFMNRDAGTDFGGDDGTFDSQVITESNEDEEESEEDSDSVEEDTEQDTDDEEDSDTESEEADTEASEDEEDTDESEDETEEDLDTEEGDETSSDTIISENAPLDESHTPNFSDGSSDRNAIASLATSASGIDPSNFITWWVGNNGPGRAFTVISSQGQEDVYRVFLQFGEGEWHVTEVEQLSSVPSEYR
ncbi:hypothetical protein ADIAL_2081 [Alkalibacterium sp. AK22]|uniref:YrrS family protein n=1 Tax=Alkalibacterium sp. AK22 TaxID=1229520 RepID=UPI0004534074|nr:YrrS family protein [Alkalibacterium sp. AK22]EXJ22495.1 hypothetical protein ADIAL_2081 [Alkalibacterium sp. AK22]